MILGGLAWLVLHTKPEPANPAYKGKRLSEWIAVYDPANTNRARQLMQETQDAIRQMGTNSIPYLLRMLEHSDSPLKVKWMRLLQKQSLVKVEYIPEMNRYERAAMALEVLGPRAKDAVPELVRIFDQNPSANAKMSIGRVLGLMGPYAKAAVPSLLREAAGTNALARANALFALGRIHANPEEVVPVLVKAALQDPDHTTRISAMSGLLLFGPAAKAAVPELVKYLETHPPPPPTTGIYSGLNEGAIAAQLLQAIDPVTAAKVLTNQPPARKNVFDMP
jgi:hypothetical protein